MNGINNFLTNVEYILIWFAVCGTTICFALTTVAFILLNINKELRRFNDGVEQEKEKWTHRQSASGSSSSWQPEPPPLEL